VSFRARLILAMLVVAVVPVVVLGGLVRRDMTTRLAAQ
jgi:hypothetical protein